ncbi:hypothetical protein DFH06DRAFT_1194988 [Mycena polygramma]|nr:hypothetical protein DFH06DRAFT_1194988 [Mycena polygramma]
MGWKWSTIPRALRRLGAGRTVKVVNAKDSGANPTSSPRFRLRDSVQDLLAARTTLLLHFPLELVEIILDLAQYWARTHSACDLVYVTAFDHLQGREVSACHLATPPILDTYHRHGSEDVRLRVARVEFSMVSRNVAGDREDNNIGWMSVDASISSPSQAPDPAAWAVATLSGTGEALRYDPALEVKGAEGGGRWTLYRNLRTDDEGTKHVVVWDADGFVAAPAVGAGDGLGSVDLLQSGNIVRDIARAVFPAWCNWIQSAEVSVFYALA